MKLIGMMDSPYVRRVAVSARLMGLALAHEQISVFRQIERFRQINPLLKAPTLVCDDGLLLMDSSLILDELESQVAPERRLLPVSPPARRQALSRIGMAMVAMEKGVQLYYETGLRPPEHLWDAWATRVRAQLVEAFALLDAALPEGGGWWGGAAPDAADVACAVAWRFCREVVPDAPGAGQHVRVAAHSALSEALPAFAECPLT